MSNGARTLAVVGIGILTAAAPVGAVDFTVNDTADLVDSDTSDGNCLTAAATCTLRAAIQQANANGLDDVITLPAGHYRLTIADAPENDAAAGDLDINDYVLIDGAGAGKTILDGNGLDRVFHVWSEAWIRDVTIRGGRTDASGGGLMLVIGEFHLESSEVIDNLANAGGGVYATLGATLFVWDSVISNNEAADIGGTNAEGGGLYTAGATEIRGTTVQGNRAAFFGGGIHAKNTSLSIINSTIAVNEDIGVNLEGSDVDILNSTIAYNGGAGLDYGSDGTHSLSVKNTILADNDQDCNFRGPTPTPLVFEDEHNLDTDGTCPLDGSANDLPSTSPQLGELLDNGGDSPTFVPEVGSPVIEAGNNATCELDDQRDAPRPLDPDSDFAGICDIGAVEVLPCTTHPPSDTLDHFTISSPGFTGEACFRADLGPGLRITDSGSLTVKTRDLIVLNNGVTVEGILVLERDPTAGSSIGLP